MSERPVSLSGEPTVDLELARSHGLSADEYRTLRKLLGRIEQTFEDVSEE